MTVEKTSIQEISSMARQLRLTLIGEQTEELLQSVGEAKMNPREILAYLFSKELERRHKYRLRMGIMSAHFSMHRTLDGFDFNVQPSIDPGRIRDLALSEWVGKAQNLLLQGPPGVGKTHLVIGLGIEAINRGYSVKFTTASQLVTQLLKAQKTGILEEKLTELCKPKLLIIDEFGYLPMQAESAHILFDLFNRRYGNRSIAITSNRPIGEWGLILNDPTAATAILDRFLHHSHVLTINGDSYRLLEKKREGLIQTAINIEDKKDY